jgi:hypothetical protein
VALVVVLGVVRGLRESAGLATRFVPNTHSATARRRRFIHVLD